MIIRFGRKTFLKNGTNIGAVVHTLDGGHDKGRMAAPRRARNHSDALMMLFVIDARGCGKMFNSLHVGCVGVGKLTVRRRNFDLYLCAVCIVGI